MYKLECDVYTLYKAYVPVGMAFVECFRVCACSMHYSANSIIPPPYYGETSCSSVGGCGPKAGSPYSDMH